MRHGDKVNALGRKKGHRDALLKSLSIALITHKRITTTQAKAKALRVHIEPILTKAKNNSTHSRRVVFSYLQDKDATNELFTTIAEKIASRPGGYTRVIKTGFRRSDGSEMAMIELVDFNTEYSSATTAAGKTRRSRRGKGAATNNAAESTPAPVVPVAPIEEVSASEEE
jgi:large subunit ribosomal protein L17